MTDPGKSIRARLLNISQDEKLSFQLVLIRYIHERLLYRLSLSNYARNFYLKGGVLLYSYSKEKTRPTKDIDFLGANIPNDREALNAAFREICSIDYTADAVVFDPDSVVAEEIANQDEYNGIRLFVEASLDTIRQRIQVDVGFGDTVIPEPVILNYPTFLPESDIPVIQAYSLETVIAEKFEAIIDLAVINSRMKDFYDVYQILTTQRINPEYLKQAILATFQNRKTSYTSEHSLFSPDFATDPNRRTQWDSFLKNSNLDQTLDFSNVVKTIIGAVPESI